jgi:tetratricopeptide (TPR) repeat protein
VEDRVIQALAHPSTDVRRLAARTLSGMGSVRAVDSLVARLTEGVEEEVVVTIEVMNALGVIGDARAEPAVRDARWRHGQASAVWIQTDLAYQMIPLAPLPADRSTMTAEDWHSRGRALLWKSEHDDAIDAYTQAIELDPKSTKSYNNRAIVWRQLGQNDKALADYDKVLLLEPGSPRTLNNRAILKRSLEDYDGALADLDQVVAGGKVGPLALRNRALTKRLMGDIEGARADLQLALDSNPKDARSYAQVGTTWAWTHDWDRALSAYEQAIAISDKYTFPVLARARILYILGRQQEASDAVDHVLRLDPHDNRARRVRAHLHMLAGRHDAAKRDLDFCLENECIRGYTRNALRYAQRAIVYHAALGDYDSALRDLQSALDSHPRREDSVAYRLEALAVSLRAGDLAAQDHWLEALAPSDRGLWHDRLMQMVHGRESYAAVVEAMDGSSQRRCLMALAGGVAAELAGDGSRAVDRYRTAAQAYEPHHLACILAGQAERFLVAD